MNASDYGRRFLPKDSLAEIRANFQEGRRVRVAGRLMTRRDMGKSTFADLKDEGARMQIYAKKDILGEEGYKAFAGLSLGDIVGLEGELFNSKTGEPTIKISKFERLSKIVRTLPEKWHGLKDVETRYRHRYVDLISNDEVRATFKARSRIIREIRAFLDKKDFMEVETPMMQPLAGGARAKPFVTHHHTLHMDLFLRVAPELYLKRLLVGGFEKVYEINRNFRNEGISVRHNPEFTMMELYQAYADYEDMMNITEELTHHLVTMLYGKEEIPYGDKTLNFKRPWKRVSFYGALEAATGMDFRKVNVREAAKNLHIEFSEEMEDIDILNEIFGEKVEKDFWDPVFVIDYPTIMTPLAKAKDEDPELVYRFELFVAKMEIANAFSELNDPTIQRERLTEQQELIGESKAIDEDFLMALEYGMPPAGGLGIGIDRVVMLLTNQASIRDVILFPQLKAEKKAAESIE
ncbi:MAG: lysine--tRNA ligase [Omnitrophica bacterium RIFOXYB12_FULL_50_7]|nr:MAG: lysine--tRNA ligase [Omnitrophica bacterium RIFOXYB12_FULL_50_7]